MFIGDLNLFFLFFFLIIFVLIVNVNTSLHFIILAELLWITLYIISLFIGFSFDNLNVLSLSFFLLVISAVEFSIGLVLILLQNILLRTINLNDFNQNNLKFLKTSYNKLFINKINWKL